MLISESYRRLNAELHRTASKYGSGNSDRFVLARQLVVKFGTRDVLDYGCGKGRLKHAVAPFADVREYDPAIEGKDGLPEPAELVICFDVLEHVEPECLDAVLDHLRDLTKGHAALAVHTAAALKVLADGRNAHLTQQPYSWWRDRLEARWTTEHIQEGHNGFFYIGAVKC